MKLLILAALAAFSLSAQEKPAPEKPKPAEQVAKATTELPKPALPPELVFNELDSTTLQLIATKAARLNDRYKIPEYQKELQPLAQQQQSLYLKACRKLGIPDDLIQKECGFESGVDLDGNVKKSPDGNPVQAKVWRQQPVALPASVGTK